MCQAPLQRQVPQAAARDMVRLDPEALGGDAFPGRMIEKRKAVAWRGMAWQNLGYHSLYHQPNRAN